MPVRHLTIRGRILAAFVAIAFIIGAMGAYAVHGITESGRLVVETFDHPLMTISHARAGLTNFAAMRETAALSRISRDQEFVRSQQERRRALRADVEADLHIAARRGQSNEVRDQVSSIRDALDTWAACLDRLDATSTPAEWAELDPLAEQVAAAFDLLIETTAGNAFLFRQQALATIDTNFWLQAAGGVAALLLAAVVAWVLAQRTVRPIEAAAAVARKIAEGDLAVDVPVATRDETGALLAAMAVMQANLRAMMDREVAQRRSAQARLVDSIESSSEAVALLDAENRIELANSQARRFFAPVADLIVPGADYREFERRALETAAFVPVTALEQSAGLPTTGRIADGRWLRVSRSAARDGGSVVIWSDITELKQREEALRAAKEQAEAANAAKTNFLTNMSHELRTPLNAVIGFSEIISTEMFGAVGQPRYRGFAQDILQSGRHLLDVINDILDIARSEAGKLQINVQPVRVAQIFVECQTIVGEQCAKAGLKLDVVPPPESLEIDADPVKLKQILINLLSNAVKFTAPGGTVTLIASGIEQGGAQLIVADTGIGMRTEDIPIALTPFGQIDSRLARKYEGTGLGLPLTKALIELHGGELDIESELGAGTVVTVRMPAGAPPSERQAA